MKTVVIGGSAHSTPSLFDTEFNFEGKDFSFELVSRSAPHGEAVVRAIRAVASERGYTTACRAISNDELDLVLPGADVVLVQFRIGGYSARSWDETFPHRYGLCGDEGLGPGGLAAAWRTWPELEKTLKAISRLCPEAIVILLTSPIGVLTRCSREAFPDLRVYGICELPWTTLQGLCRPALQNAQSANYAYIAVNHLGWFADLAIGGTTVLGVDETRSLKYVRLDDAPHDVLREQRIAPTRGRELAGLASSAYAVYGSGGYEQIIAAIRRRQTPWYAHAVAPLLHALAGKDVSTTFFLTARNDGYCDRFAADDFIEMPYDVVRGGLRRREVRRWTRDDIANRLRRLIAFERSAAATVRSRDERGISISLRLHPWLDGTPISEALVSDVSRMALDATATSIK